MCSPQDGFLVNYLREMHHIVEVSMDYDFHRPYRGRLLVYGDYRVCEPETRVGYWLRSASRQLAENLAADAAKSRRSQGVRSASMPRGGAALEVRSVPT